ncbi:MAG TPA: DUF1549 domain-containing protein [Isosphaeraceae bacterium]
MRRHPPPALLLAALIGCLGASPAPSSSPSEAERALTAQVDAHLARAWADAKVEPTRAADDAEYLRRVSLDVAGKVPTAAEARAFLDDPRPDKRARLVERLLRGPAAANHAVNTWRALLIPEAGGAAVSRILVPDFEVWLRRRIAGEAGLDALVRDLLTAPILQPNRVISDARAATDPSPMAYYAAKGYRPEDLAASTARLFLGVRIECAQCHDHPFSSWKRDEFWGLAASFAGISAPRQPNALATNPEDRSRRTLEIPGTKRTAKARFLDGSEPLDDDTTREALARWITSAPVARDKETPVTPRRASRVSRRLTPATRTVQIGPQVGPTKPRNPGSRERTSPWRPPLMPIATSSSASSPSRQD